MSKTPNPKEEVKMKEKMQFVSQCNYNRQIKKNSPLCLSMHIAHINLFASTNHFDKMKFHSSKRPRAMSKLAKKVL